jgi:hypothetical protein
MTQLFVAFVVILGVLAAVTRIGLAQTEAVHPPRGEFVEVQGVRLHIVVLGLAHGASGADPAGPWGERKSRGYASCARREASPLPSRDHD